MSRGRGYGAPAPSMDSPLRLYSRGTRNSEPVPESNLLPSHAHRVVCTVQCLLTWVRLQGQTSDNPEGLKCPQCKAQFEFKSQESRALTMLDKFHKQISHIARFSAILGKHAVADTLRSIVLITTLRCSPFGNGHLGLNSLRWLLHKMLPGRRTRWYRSRRTGNPGLAHIRRGQRPLYPIRPHPQRDPCPQDILIGHTLRPLTLNALPWRPVLCRFNNVPTNPSSPIRLPADRTILLWNWQAVCRTMAHSHIRTEPDGAASGSS